MTIIIVVSVGASLLWASRWFHHSEDLGYVSAQWLSEYRQNHES
jgi:hypothetical protein